MQFNRTKGLIGALAISGFLNIILITSIFYGNLRERSPALYCEQKPALKLAKQSPLAVNDTSGRLIYRLRELPYEQLTEKLKSTIPVEHGYLERDFALAYLISRHHFDLARAMEGSSFTLQERVVTYRQPTGLDASVNVFSSLNAGHFEAILRFAATERWPQTSKGLFLLLQKKKENRESTLSDAFLLTPEFLSIEPLFKRTDSPVDKTEIVDFLIEGNWTMLSRIANRQRLDGDVSDERRKSVLLEYLKKGSPAATKLLAKIDSSFDFKPEDTGLRPATKKTDEPRVEKISLPAPQKKLSNAEKKTPPSSQPTSFRKSDFSNPDRLYIVQEGDTLWKLSKRFNIEVDILKKYNKLTSDSLAPNSAIRIPTN